MKDVIYKVLEMLAEGIFHTPAGKIAITIALVSLIVASLMGCSTRHYVRQTTWRNGGDTITMIYEQIGDVTKSKNIQ